MGGRRKNDHDHNYDHGSLYIESDGTWRIVAPTEPGPQPDATGGQIAVHLSSDQGLSWRTVKTLRPQYNRNQTYVRRPWKAHADFYSLWADGDALNLSASDLYFADRKGEVFRLPRTIDGDYVTPQPVSSN